MRRSRPRSFHPFVICFSIAGIVSAGPASADEAVDPVSWPRFRGQGASGIDDSAPLPENWNIEQGENLLWKVNVPGLGHSSPVIWGDRIFLTTAERTDGDQDLKVGLYGDIRPVDDEGEFQWKVLCYSRTDGSLQWERTAHEGNPAIKRHTKSTHANSTPATDGKVVVAFFGSEGLHCYGVDGSHRWSKDFGVLDSGYFAVPQAQWGFGSSPVLHEDRIIVQCDVQENSFLTVLDSGSGEEIWRVPREDVPTWSTPVVHIGEKRRQIILNGYRYSGGYSLEDGKNLWRIDGGGDIPVPTPVVAGELVFLTSAHGPMSPIFAVRMSASGNITPEREDAPGEHVAWFKFRGGSYMQTPIVYRGVAYFCRDNGVLAAHDPESGDRHFIERISGGGGMGFTSSAVAGDGKLYYTNEDGEVFVMRAGKEFELLARNSLGEIHMSTPAIAGGSLYFRTRGHLIAVGGAGS